MFKQWLNSLLKGLQYGKRASKNAENDENAHLCKIDSDGPTLEKEDYNSSDFALNALKNTSLDSAAWIIGFLAACEQALNHFEYGTLDKYSLIINACVSAEQRAKAQKTKERRYQQMCIAGNQAGIAFCTSLLIDKKRSNNERVRRIKQECQKYTTFLFNHLDKLNEL
jgi:hypothetical protein